MQNNHRKHARLTNRHPIEYFPEQSRCESLVQISSKQIFALSLPDHFIGVHARRGRQAQVSTKFNFKLIGSPKIFLRAELRLWS